MRKNTFVSFVLILSFVLSTTFNVGPAKAAPLGSTVPLSSGVLNCYNTPTLGQQVRVTSSDGVKVRSTPAGTRIGAQTFGSLGVVTGGPTFADQKCWVQVNYDNAPDGWSATEWLEVVSSSTSSSSSSGSSFTYSGTSGSSGGASGGGGTANAASSIPNFNINSLGSNTINIVPVYLEGTSIGNNDVQSKANDMVNYYQSQSTPPGGQPLFRLTANVSSPMAVSNFTSGGQTGTCLVPQPAGNTMYVYVGTSTGGRDCSYNTPYFIGNNTQNGLAHEFGHILGLEHAPGVMSTADVAYQGYNLTDAQKQQLGWPTSGGGTTTPSTGNTSAPSTSAPCGTGPHIGNCVDIGAAGHMALVCPSETIVVPSNSYVNIRLTAVRDSIVVVSAEIPSRNGPMGRNDAGVRGRVTAGFRPHIPSLVTLGQNTSFASLPVEVTAQPGFYSVDVEGSVPFSRVTSNPNEPYTYMAYSTCKTSFQVIPANSQPTSQVRIYGIVGANIPVQEMVLQPGDTVPVQFYSASTSACYLSVNGAPRTTLNSRTEGSFTSDPARSGARDEYIIRCQVAGAPPGTLTPVTADSTFAITSGFAPSPGGIFASIQMTTVEPVPQTDIGEIFDTVTRERVTQINVMAGTSVRVYFNSNNATNCALSPFGINGTSGNTTLSNLQAGVNMTLTCQNAFGQVIKRAQINVMGNVSAPPSSYETVSCFPTNLTALTQENNVVGSGLNTDFVIQPFPVRVDVRSSSSGPVNFSSTWSDFTGQNESNGPVLVSSSTGNIGTNTLLFRPRPVIVGGAHPVSSGTLTINANRSGGGSFGSCVVEVALAPVSRNTPGRTNISVNPNPININLHGTGTITLSGGRAPYYFTSVSNGQVVRSTTTPVGSNVGQINARIEGDRLIINSIGSTPGIVLFEVGDSDPAGPGGYRWTQVGVNLVDSGGVNTYSQQQNISFTQADGQSTSGSASQQVGNQVSVTANTLNLRVSATTQAQAVGQLPLGQTVTVLSAPVQRDGYTWYRVQSENGVRGFVAGEFLKNTTTNLAPVISSISPESGPVGIAVTLRGSNLSSNNTVHFGSGVLPVSILGSDGRLGFIVPSVLDYACSNATPPCSASTTQVVPGIYAVSVSGSGGTSNAVNFKVTVGNTVSPDTTADKKVRGAQTFIFTQMLQNGSSGNEVVELQGFLNRAGYDPGIPDGRLGLKTEVALIKFQIANGLEGDGVTGPITRALLNK